MTRRLLLFLLLWLSGLFPVASRAMEYLCRFPASDRVTISGVATDKSGSTYLCGYVGKSASFADAIRIGETNLTEWEGDALLIKLAADGTRLATVVLGGEGFDFAQKIAVDSSGNVVVLGYTTSQSFPVHHALQPSMGGGGSDLFIAKFDATCTNLIFSTYVGGSRYEDARALAVDRQGDILFAGRSDSDEFPAAPDPFPWRDSGAAFLAKLSNDGAQWRYANRIGGSRLDSVSAMALDNEDNAYLTGYTFSPDFPVLNALQTNSHSSGASSAFVSKVAPDGSLAFSTFLSGDYGEGGVAIALNTAGEIFVAGSTHSEVFPVLGSEPFAIPTNLVMRLFLAKLNASGASILATNFHRTQYFDQFAALATAPDGRVVGAGTLCDFIGLPFFTLFNEDSTTFTPTAGRFGCEPLASIEAIAFDTSGNLIVAGRELSAPSPASGSYVARYQTNAWQQRGPAQVHILSPKPGMTLAPSQSSEVKAEITGATGTVSSVKFYDGRRVVGIATNAPFSLTWKKVSRGRHRLTAVAVVDGRTVTSCVANVTAMSPPNDAFPGRVLLKRENVEVTGDTMAATGEGQYPPYQTVWYSWKAPRDGLYHLAVSNLEHPLSSFHTVAVFTGSRLNSLVPASESYRSSAAIRAQRGEVFRIRVSGYSSYGAELTRFQLRIRRMTPPANDDFANATVLTGDSLSAPVAMRDAASEAGELYGHVDRHYADERSVWFAWTAPRSGLFLASVTGLDYLPFLTCFTGNTISNLTSVGQSVSGETNGVALYAQAGTRYYLKLIGENTNNLTLHLTPYSPPQNDHFADRFVIPFGFTSVTGTMIGATSEPGEPGGLVDSFSSVWWTWTPPTTGVFRVTASTIWPPVTLSSSGLSIPARPGRWSPQIQVFKGDELAQLVPESGAEGTSLTGETFLRAFAGTNYQIAVQSDAARFVLKIVPALTPANDDFEAAIELFGPRVVKAGSTYAATSQPGEGWRGISLPGDSNSDSVWYRWTAPSNGYFAFSLDGANLLELYEGAALDTLTTLASGEPRHVIQVVSGVEYRLAVVSGRSFRLSIQPAQRPANDDFANRQVVSGLDVQISVDARDAAGEPGEPLFQHFYPARRSLWYSWTAPTNGSFRLVSTNYDSARISIFTGNVLTNLARVAEGDSYTGIEFVATRGVTYQIAVDPSSWRMQFGLRLFYQPPPPNDDFASRLRLKGSQVSLTVSNTGASREIGEPLNGPGAAGRTAWWTWRAPRTGRVTFDVGYYGKMLGVYTGNWLTRLTPLTDTNRTTSIDNLPVQAGVDYHISVDDYWWNNSGSFQLRIAYTAFPPNDNFAKRRAFSDQVSGNLEGGSLEPGEPSTGSSTARASVWWTWTSASNGSCRFELSPPYSANLELYTGDSLDRLHRMPADFPCPGSCILARVTAGSTYLLRVVGPAIPTPYTLTATFSPAPANDDFTNRVMLAGAPLSVVGSNHIATAEPGEPEHNTTVARRSVWWSWTAPSSGAVQIILLPYSEMRVAVYTGDGLENLQHLASGLGLARLLNAVQGTTYQVAIDTEWWNADGDEAFTWSLSYEQPAPGTTGSDSDGGLAHDERIFSTAPSAPSVIEWRIPAREAADSTALRIIETSTNLVDWFPYTNALTNPAELRIVPSTNEPYRFFRVR